MAVTLQSRLGVAKLGASRLGWAKPLVKLAIDGADFTSRLVPGTLKIFETLNDQPGTASFELTPNTAFRLPTVGNEVSIGLVSSDNVIFAGTITSWDLVPHGALLSSDSGPVTFRINCSDWTWSLNRRLVFGHYTGKDPGQIAKDIVSAPHGTSDGTVGFTTNHVSTGFNAIDIVFEGSDSIGQALTRLANIAGAHWYVDYARDVHFFTSESLPNPTDLTPSAGTLETFGYTDDLTQARTRDFVIGAAARTLFDDSGCSISGVNVLPLDDASAFATGGGKGICNGIVFSYDSAYAPEQAVSCNMTSYNSLTAEMGVSETGLFSAGGGVILVNNALATYTGRSTSSGAGNLTGILWPAGNVDPAAGASVTPVGYLSNVHSKLGDFPVGTTAFYPGTVSVWVQRDDASAQTTLGAAGSALADGVYEHRISDSALNDASAQMVGDADLSLFAGSEVIVRYNTRDPKTRPGRVLTVNMRVGTGSVHGSPVSVYVTATVKVQSVTITDIDLAENVFPLRQVVAATTKFTIEDLFRRTPVRQG